MIYFIQENEVLRSKIKIGFSEDVSKRFRSLQTQNSVKLKLLLVLPGDQKTESAYHDLFSKYRTHGEWFKPGLGLRLFILKNKLNHIEYEPVAPPIENEPVAPPIENEPIIESVVIENKPLTNDTFIIDSIINDTPLPIFCPDKIIKADDTFSLIKYCDIIKRPRGRPKIKKDWVAINKIALELMIETNGKVSQNALMKAVAARTNDKINFPQARELKESLKNKL